MNNAKALDLIKKGIEGLLYDIQHGRDPWMDHTDLAEEIQIDDEHVIEWLEHNRGNAIVLITLGGTHNEEFISLIERVMESEWYEEQYQRAVAEAREGIMEERDWEKTKKSLMPKGLH